MTKPKQAGMRSVAAMALLLCLAGCASLSPRFILNGGGAFRDTDLARPAELKILDAPDVPVVKDGRSIPIVVADTPRAFGAAIQLADIIRRATGVKPDIIREFPGTSATNRPALFVGETSTAASLGLTVPCDDPEAFRVVTNAGDVFFLGREDFAVFDWCERQLGARCFWLDKDGEELSVPRVDDISATAVDYMDKPAYEMRVCGSCANQHWARFSKVGNVHRGAVKVHAPHKWNSDPVLVAERPEIFALASDGRRATSPLLCYGNPATLEYYESRIDEAIAGVRDSGGIVDVQRKVITVSPWDVAYNCTCEHCTPLYDESLGPGGNASPIVWGRFLKGLARWAKDNHPDYIISFLPYWNMCEVPPGLDLNEEGNCEAEVCVMPGLALMKDESVKWREEEIIRKWTEVTGRKAILWHYTCWPAEFTVAPYLFGNTIRRHWQDMRGLVDGCFICGGGEVPRLSLMYYVWMRCMWNPEVDVEAIYDTFCKRMFGPAAKPMRRLIALQESGWSRRWIGEEMSDGNVYGISYPPWTVREMRRLITSAERLAANDREALRRVRRYASVFANFFDEADMVHAGAPKPALRLANVEGMPVIDGLLDDSCWDHAFARRFVRAMDRVHTEPKYPTEVRGVWSDEGIALGFRFVEPDVGAMPTGKGVDDHKGQDLVNVLIADSSSSGKKVAWRFRFDADGRLSLFEGSFPRPINEARVAIHKGDGFWSAELFVPYCVLGGRHDAFVGNVSRWRAGAVGEWTRLSTRFSISNSDPNAFVPFTLDKSL